MTALARRRPWKLAKEAATLDRLSGGRLVVGVGLGGGGDLEPVGETVDGRERGGLSSRVPLGRRVLGTPAQTMETTAKVSPYAHLSDEELRARVRLMLDRPPAPAA